MGVLSGFLKNENRGSPPATVATSATPARKVATVATVATGECENQIPKVATVATVAAPNHRNRMGEGSAPDTRPEVASPIVHRCGVCGAIASFGFGWSVKDPDAGRWYCAEHAPKRGAA